MATRLKVVLAILLKAVQVTHHKVDRDNRVILVKADSSMETLRQRPLALSKSKATSKLCFVPYRKKDCKRSTHQTPLLSIRSRNEVLSRSIALQWIGKFHANLLKIL